MPRYARPAAPAFDAIEIEGALIAPAMLTKIAASQADGQTDASYHVPKGLTLRDEIARYFRIGQAQFRDFAKLDSPFDGGDQGVRRAPAARRVRVSRFSDPLLHTRKAGER